MYLFVFPVVLADKIEVQLLVSRLEALFSYRTKRKLSELKYQCDGIFTVTLVSPLAVTGISIHTQHSKGHFLFFVYFPHPDGFFPILNTIVPPFVIS